MIKSRVSPNLEAKLVRGKFLRAIERDDIKSVRFMLLQRPISYFLLQESRDQWPLIHYAKSGEMVDFLVSLGVDPDPQSTNTPSPFICSLSSENVGLCEAFIRNGADLRPYRDSVFDESAIYRAFGEINLNIDLVLLLMHAGDDTLSDPREMKRIREHFEESGTKKRRQAFREIMEKVKQWPRVVTLRTMCLRVTFSSRVNTADFPRLLLNFPNELEEAELHQQALKTFYQFVKSRVKRRRDDSHEMLDDFAEANKKRK